MLRFEDQTPSARIQLSSSATERFEHTLGKAMDAVPPARIPANMGNAPVLFAGLARL
jgi:hypothetical protein